MTLPDPTTLDDLRTESPNASSRGLDAMSVANVLAVMNAADRTVPDAVGRVLPEVETVVHLAVDALRAGGRLIYLGAGTSGRLGVLDAAECPPTFGIDAGQVLGLLAGGRNALVQSAEGAEDNPGLAVADLSEIGLVSRDVVIGIAASGRTPYVVGGLDHARSLGCQTVAIACTSPALISAHADVAIEIDTGPEVLRGSTRLKAGTAQKLVLNLVSTATMVRLGKVYGNLMVDVRPSNEKLRARVLRIVCEATGCSAEEAYAAVTAADGHAKTAIVMVLAGLDAPTARERLDSAGGFVRGALAWDERAGYTSSRLHRAIHPGPPQQS